MNTEQDFDLESLTDLTAVFEHIDELEGRKAAFAAQLVGTIEYACATWGLSKPAVKAAYKWWGMTDGEKEDWENTWEKCKTALRVDNKPDLFSPDLEMAFDSVRAARGKRQPKVTAHLTTQ